jgi:hypothetical protein
MRYNDGTHDHGLREVEVISVISSVEAAAECEKELRSASCELFGQNKS